MRLLTLSLAASVVHAFKDTSPFFFLSTSELPLSISANLAPASTISSAVFDSLSSCPSISYLLVSQPGSSIADFTAPGAAPHLRGAVVNGTDGLKERVVIPEVYGEIDLDKVLMMLIHECGASLVHAEPSTGEIPILSSGPRVVRIKFDPLPTEHKARIAKLSDHDSFLHAILSTLDTKQPYTIVYSTSPPDTPLIPPAYTTDDNYDPVLHTEFKRDAGAHPGFSTSASKAPLFERYVFVQPSIFMAFFVVLPLLFLLYVGLSALSGLKVSYYAFSKEMGPAAQKKQQ